MSDVVFGLLMLFAWIMGVVFGYITWAPMSPFKQGLIEGMTFKFLWNKK